MANCRRIFVLRSSKLVILGCTLLIQASITSLIAQTSAGSEAISSLTLNARTVIVDVVVTGRGGKPITGLTQQDFTIAEDGLPQQITTFEEHPGPHPQPRPSPLPANVFTNIPRALPTASPIVLLFDSLNTPLSNQALVRKQMLSYLQHLQPGPPMAIFILGSQLRSIQSFTQDPTLLRSVLQNLKSGSGPQASTLLDSKTESTAETLGTQINATLRQFDSEQISSKAGARVLITLNALQQLARYLAGIPGRKSVIWFSGAFPSTIFTPQSLVNPELPERMFNDETRRTDAVLSAAQVAIYPFAAEGLANDSLYDVGTQLTAQSAQEFQRQSIETLNTGANLRNANHAIMEQIAQETGGEAFYNTNDFNKAIQRVTEDGSHFYTLSYTPTTASRGDRFRKITIRLRDDPHAHLAYRRGYFTSVPQPATTPKPNLDPLRPYLQPGVPDSTEIPLAFVIQPATTSDTAKPRCSAGDNHNAAAPLTCYDVSFIVALRGLHLTTDSGGIRHASMNVTLLANNADGKALNWVVRRINLDMDASRYAQLLSEGIHFSLTIGVPRSAISLSGGVFDPSSGLAGTLTVPMATIAPAVRSTKLIE